VSLDACVIAPTVNPEPVIDVEAAACVRPTTFGTATRAGPVETVNATADPGATCAPAAGFWLITWPAGTVSLDAWVIAPTLNPEPVIDVEAAACVRPTTFGTATRAGPVETVKATADPGATCAPAAGFWLITWPAGTVLLDAWVIAPTLNPAPLIAVEAAACDRPTTLGTATGAGPVETVKATADPGATCAPAAGFWLITWPAGTVSLDAWVIAPTLNPEPVIDVEAAACDRPTTLGTATGAGPVETVSATADPGAT
jgi:acetoacetate decarboxylase